MVIVDLYITELTYITKVFRKIVDCYDKHEIHFSKHFWAK